MSNTVIHSERGGVRYGLEPFSDQMNWTYPFARLTISNNDLMITYPFRKMVCFKRDEVSFENHHNYMGRGVRFLHQNENIPIVFIFWSLDTTHLLDILKKWKNMG